MALTRDQVQWMVFNSRSHDKKYEREYTAADFITAEAVESLIVAQTDQCVYCHHPFDHETPSRKHPDAPTLERLNEDLAHVTVNCVLACAYCNNARQGKTVEEMKTYAFHMKMGWVKYCPDCKTYFEDPEEVFHKDRTKHDGLCSNCRSCTKARMRTYHAGNARRNKAADAMKEPVNHVKIGRIKYCSDCKTFYENPKEVFNKNRTRHDGLHHICRSCHKGRMRTYHDNKKAARG